MVAQNYNSLSLEGAGGDLLGQIVLPLLPVPDMVLLPGEAMSLRVVDPRYCELTRQALRSDGTVVVAFGEYGRRMESVRHIATKAQIVHHNALEDGTFHVLLLGTQRVKLIETVENGFRFQSVRAELLKDGDELAVGVEGLREDLCSWLPELLDNDMARRELAESLGEAEDDQLVAAAVTLLELPSEAKQTLLEAESPLDRLLTVHSMVRQGVGQPDPIRGAAVLN